MTATGGTISVAGATGGNGFSPSPPTQIAPFADPWASRTDLPPATAGLTAKTDPCSATATGGQGIYGDFAVPKGTCTLQPGLYVITGAWTEGQPVGADRHGGDALLHVHDGWRLAGVRRGRRTGRIPGRQERRDQRLRAPTPPSTRAVQDVAIMYDRSNTRSIGLQGNGGTSISGSVYAPRSDLDFNGSSCFGFGNGAASCTACRRRTATSPASG